MKTLRQVCAATILSLMIVVSASAGDLHAPGKASTDNPTPVVETERTDDSTDDTALVTQAVILVVLSLIYR